MANEPAFSEGREPELLRRIEHAARRVADLEAETSAERERRDRLMAEAEAAGHPYRAIAAAARRGDGHATTTMVQKAVIRYAK